MSTEAPLTWDTLLNTYQEFASKYGSAPKHVECSNGFYYKLRIFFEEDQKDKEMQGIEIPEVSDIQLIYGIQVIVDPKMKDDEWKFIY